MAGSSTNDTMSTETDQLQGELFSQLSLRCHEQNWAQVHAIAEKLALLKREPKPKQGATSRADGDDNSNEDGLLPGDVVDSTINADRQRGIKSPLSYKSYPNTPHMLSTCLGTASPLAWTCRYSAPSSTVKLVLDLDLSAVRRCLPQLGTPLHEIVGRPRPLRKTPLKQSRWTNMIRNSITSACTSTTTIGAGAQAQEPVKPLHPIQDKHAISTSSSAASSNKKTKKQAKLPLVLKGLHVWRRTVRELIQADESLKRDDANIASSAAAKTEHGNHEAIQTMIRENVSNINKVKAAMGCDDADATIGEVDRPSLDAQNFTAGPQRKSPPNQSPPHQEHRFSIRATIAQDADGNTPLHFMIRGAAAPTLGGMGWQAHHDLEEDDEDDNEEVGGEDENESEMHDGYQSQVQTRELRRTEFRGMNGSTWDGIRWCMEAHLRRVKRRVARRSRLEKEMANGDESNSDEKRDFELRVASCHIANRVDRDDAPVGKAYALKRKSLEMFDENAQSNRNAPAVLKSSPQLEATRTDAGNRKRLRSRRLKYFDADEHQDCCFDPLLGAVRDLVYSCPEAVGIPDHREYEETPLIVALKSSIYVLMEPDTEFHLTERLTGADGVAALQPPGGMDGEQNGGGFAGFPHGGIRDFRFPELGLLFQNQPMNILQDDEAMMDVLRGHRRRSIQGSRRNPSATFSPGRGSDDIQMAESGTTSETQCWQQGSSQEKEELDIDRGDDDHSSCSSVSDDPISDQEDDPRYDAFVPSEDEQIFSHGMESPGSRLGLLPLRRPRYDYQTALEYRIFCLVRIMLDAYPRAACLMISDYTPLHSAVFHGRCPDTIRILLEAEARFRRSANSNEGQEPLAAIPLNPMLCPTLPGPALLCTNTRGELPLHFACMSNQCVRSIRLLVRADPRAALVRDASGRTPLRWLWIRFVDGLLDRFGGRDTQGHNDGPNLAFMEQEGGNTPNFPNPGQRALGMSQSRMMSTLDSLNGRCYDSEGEDTVSSNSMFVFDVGYISRTRSTDRTVDFLRMRHIPSQFEHIENVAAEHAITVLLKLKYLQQRRTRQLAAFESGARSSTSNVALPLDAPLSTKEEFILYAFEKFTALIHAALIASEAEAQNAILDSTCSNRSQVNNETQTNFPDSLSRKKLWHSLPRIDSSKRFFLVHEACRSSRASCPAAVAKICIKLFSDQLFEQDDDGQLPLHKVASRGLGWEPPGSDHDTNCVSLADETLTLLKLVLSESHTDAPRILDNQKQLPLHCAIDSLVTSLTMGKKRRATLHAEARVVLQKYRHTHVEIAMECLTELLRANAQALLQRDGKSGLYPFMQAAVPHGTDNAVVKYTSDLSRSPGVDVGASFHSMDSEIVEESDDEAECDHVSIIYFLLREDPSVINCCC